MNVHASSANQADWLKLTGNPKIARVVFGIFRPKPVGRFYLGFDRAEEVIDWIEEQEEAEEFVIGLIDEEQVPPGTYYPISAATKERFRAWKANGGK